MKYKLFINWVITALIVMLLCPYAIAQINSENLCTLLCIILFFIINTLYSGIMGYQCGKNMRLLWSLPLLSSVLFLTGAWLFFRFKGFWIIIYSGIYLTIGYVSMISSKIYTTYGKNLPDKI